MRTWRTASWTLALLLTLAPLVRAQVPTPEQHFGFRMGADRQLASADAIERYFELVASRSDRVRVLDLGPTTDGHRTVAAAISAAENIRTLDKIRSDNALLADPRSLSVDEARSLARSQKVVVAIGASIHASEVGGTQAANELLYTLASSNDPAILQVLQNVVVLLIPSLNPDGHRLVTDWYARTKGTPYEGGPMPWLFHKYAGHDINRDAFMMNLAENRNLARFFYNEWHPQVFLTIHQMEENGPRFFVPPNTDPIDPNYDPLIWRSAALLGSAMALEMQRDGRTGVVSDAKYDYYWPGFEDSAPLGHNTICLLTEVASANIASPIDVTAAELRGGFKGLSEYRPQINFPDPWPGGRWTLRDIVDYDLSAVRGLLLAASAYRETLVQNFYDMGRRAVERGAQGDPFAFIVPTEQFDPLARNRLEELLMLGAVEIHRALEPFRADGEPYPEGTDIIFMAQPYRAYVKTLLERQRYPGRRLSPDGPWERPYDVAGWTLPAQMGVKVLTIERTFEPPPTTRLTKVTPQTQAVWGEKRPQYWMVDAAGTAGILAVNRLAAAGANVSWTTAATPTPAYRFPAGSLVVPYSRDAEPVIARLAATLGLRIDGMKGRAPDRTAPIGSARVGLYKAWGEITDEGWTELLFAQYELPFTSLTDADVRGGGLRAKYDAIVVPSATAERLVSGFPEGSVPTEYTGGLGPAGVAALRSFVQEGGTLLCLDKASSLALQLFDLPIHDVARDDGRLFVPGSILKITLDPAQPLAFGMPAESAGFFSFSSAFDLAAPAPADVDIVARYAADDLLISGWMEGERAIAGKAAVVRARVGTGHVVLFGFPVQHRAQSLATFRLLFNALFDAR